MPSSSNSRGAVNRFIINKLILKSNMDFIASKPILNSFFTFLGIIILLIAYFIIEKLTREYLETNYRKNNTAVAIVFGALIGFQ
jgi:uncharacterized membrane protein YjfL (UPF0719 family)